MPRYSVEISGTYTVAADDESQACDKALNELAGSLDEMTIGDATELSDDE